MNCTQLKFLLFVEEEQQENENTRNNVNRLKQNIDADNWKRTEHYGIKNFLNVECDLGPIQFEVEKQE